MTAETRTTLDLDAIERALASSKPKRRLRWAVLLLIDEVRRLRAENERLAGVVEGDVPFYSDSVDTSARSVPPLR